MRAPCADFDCLQCRGPQSICSARIVDSLVADSPKECGQKTTLRETGHHLVAAKSRAKVTSACCGGERLLWRRASRLRHDERCSRGLQEGQKVLVCLMAGALWLGGENFELAGKLWLVCSSCTTLTTDTFGVRAAPQVVNAVGKTRVSCRHAATQVLTCARRWQPSVRRYLRVRGGSELGFRSGSSQSPQPAVPPRFSALLILPN